MTEPQTWTVIGGFLTAIFAMLGIITSSFNRTVRTEVGSVRTEVGSLRSEVTAEISGLRGEMNAKFELVDAQFERVYDRLNYLDRDVQAITRHVFPDRE